MNSRGVRLVLMLVPTLVLAWITPRWLEGIPSGIPEAIRPPPDATSDEPQGQDPRLIATVETLTSLPHVPALGKQPVRVASINGVPIVNCGFQSYGSCTGIMDYYLGQLAATGWRDITDRYFGIAPENPSADDADQTEQAAEKYEEIRSTQAVLVRNGRSVAISLAAQPMGRCFVSITVADTPDLTGFWRSTYDRGMALSHRDGAQKWLETSEPRRGGGESKTRFYTGRGNPSELIAKVAGDMRRDGWSIVLPPQASSETGKSCMFMKPGGRWAMVTAEVQPHNKASRAVLYIQ
jgi:hypothetical protein